MDHVCRASFGCHGICAYIKSQVSADFRVVCKKAVAPTQTPIIILGGFLAGVMTPTEASAIAVAYALIVSFFILKSMSLKHLTTAAMGAAMLASSSLARYAAGHAEYTIRATANSNENDEDYDGLVVFKNYVEAASNGKIEVELFIGTQLCSKGAECLQGVADRSIDVYISTSGGAASIFPYVQVLDLPYLMADDRIAEDVLSGDFVRTMRDMALEDSDDKIRLMTIGNTGGWRNFDNTKRRLAEPADFDGLKIRTVVADLPQELVRALGASPTPIPWPELFTSFQTGVVDGSNNGITDIMGMKFPDAGLQYVTLDGHAYMGAMWWMSNDKFRRCQKICAAWLWMASMRCSRQHLPHQSVN